MISIKSCGVTYNKHDAAIEQHSNRFPHQILTVCIDTLHVCLYVLKTKISNQVEGSFGGRKTN